MASLFSFFVQNSFNLSFYFFSYSWVAFRPFYLVHYCCCCLWLFSLVPPPPLLLLLFAAASGGGGRGICFVYFYFHWIFRRGEPDESIGTIADTRMNHQYPQTCFGSSEYELALILKELRWITDQVNWIELEYIHIDSLLCWFLCEWVCVLKSACITCVWRQEWGCESISTPLCFSVIVRICVLAC